MEYAVPVGLAIVCLVLAGCMHFIGGHCPRVVLVLVLVASMGMAGAAGAGLHTAVNSAVSASNQASAAALGGSLTLGLTILCGYVLVHNLRRKRGGGAALAVHGGHGGGGGRRGGGGGGTAGNGPLIAAAALPWLAASTPGQVGSVMTSALSAVAAVVGGFGRLLGL